MSLLTIVEASKQFNVGRTAIYKAIKKGELTAQINHDGIKVVDAQDMIRIFRPSSKKVFLNLFPKTVPKLFLETAKTAKTARI